MLTGLGTGIGLFFYIRTIHVSPGRRTRGNISRRHVLCDILSPIFILVTTSVAATSTIQKYGHSAEAIVLPGASHRFVSFDWVGDGDRSIVDDTVGLSWYDPVYEMDARLTHSASIHYSRIVRDKFLVVAISHILAVGVRFSSQEESSTEPKTHLPSSALSSSL